ncbi:MAG: lamin tail domain-containing protein, partial [Chitinophagales bacterium]|nr:lamin tail domain-containing protein [Chitinophagales bacterium]
MKTQNGFILPFLILFLFDFRHSSAKIVINEYCAANKSVLVTSNEQKLKRGNVVTKDKFEDWIELYNNSDDDIILDGFFLSDDPQKLNKYPIPSGIIISAKSHIIFICSGKNITTGGYYHTNFKLSQTKGNDVIVLSFDGNIIDSVRVFPCRANHSRGRMTDGAAQWGILDQPTPSQPNVSVKEKYLRPPVCNVEAGFYSHPVTITFFQIEPNCEIYFTTDGTDPTNSLTASLYQGSFQIHQTSVIRAVSKPLAGHNALPSPVITNTYFINEQHVLPVVSLCSSYFDDLFQFIKPAIEIEGSFEFFDKNKVRKVKIEGGIKGHGNDSWYYEQKGMRFYARDEYGDNATINYPFFATSSRTKYDCLILRAGGSDNYVGFAGAAPSTHLRDGFSQTLAEKGGLHLDTRKYEPVIVYINGKYWGIYELREPFDLEYTKAYYGEGKEG